MDKIIYCSPFGPWLIAASETGIVSVSLCHGNECDRGNPHLRLVREQLDQYFSGKPTTFTVPLDLRGTAFQLKVWNCLRSIPYGEKRSYSEIAQMIGEPTSTRAVGQAVGKNPCLILVPCHRVIGKNGNLTGFSAGVDLKTRLLQMEE